MHGRLRQTIFAGAILEASRAYLLVGFVDRWALHSGAVDHDAVDKVNNQVAMLYTAQRPHKDFA
jgi:hypothetical protein